LLTAINDTIYNYETERKIAVLQFNSEIQKKQAEIDLLTRDKTLKEMDLKRQGVCKKFPCYGTVSCYTGSIYIIQELPYKRQNQRLTRRAEKRTGNEL
jgi:hypothetical protein